LLAGELLARKHVPQTKFGLEPPVGLAREPAGEKGLGVDGAPVLEARDRVGIDDALDVGGGVDRREQAGAFEVVGDDLRDPTRGFAIARSAADAQNLRVDMNVKLRMDGSLAAAPVLLERGTSPYFQVFAESALRAVERCQPYSLPAAKYEVWKDIDLGFRLDDLYGG